MNGRVDERTASDDVTNERVDDVTVCNGVMNGRVDERTACDHVANARVDDVTRSDRSVDPEPRPVLDPSQLVTAAPG